MDDRSRTSEAEDPQQNRGAKRPYATPQLIEYGSVTQLTAGSLSKQSDAAAAGFKRV